MDEHDLVVGGVFDVDDSALNQGVVKFLTQHVPACIEVYTDRNTKII